jgi:hypothetical protein
MGYVEDNVFRPMPSYKNIEALNVDLRTGTSLLDAK